MEWKTWQDVKDFVNSLTEKQLKELAYIYPTESRRICIDSLDILTEPLYVDVDNEEEGAFFKSDISEDEWEEMDVKEVLPIGSVFVGAE